MNFHSHMGSRGTVKGFYICRRRLAVTVHKLRCVKVLASTFACTALYVGLNSRKTFPRHCVQKALHPTKPFSIQILMHEEEMKHFKN